MELANRAVSISPSPTLAIDAKAKQMKATGIKVYNFGVGEPDFDTPEHIRIAAIEAINAGMTRYTPASGTMQLKQAIQEKFKRDNQLEYETAQIIVSSGAKHSLYNAFQVLVQEGDEVILPAPYWVSHLEQIKIAGGKPVIVMTKEENNFKMTPEELQQAITSRTKIVLLNTPSNPTGSVYSKDELKKLGDLILEHQKICVISDEIYEKLIYDGKKHVSIAAISPELKERTIVINGVSKAYAMTGWRIGYVAAPLKIAKAMANLQSHATSNPSSISQAASVVALNGTQEPLAQMNAEFVKRRDCMLELLSSIPGITCPKPNGAFYLFPNVSSYFGKEYQGQKISCASDLAAIFLEKIQVAVVPGVAFGNDNYLRFSYATGMQTIVEAMAKIKELMAAIK